MAHKLPPHVVDTLLDKLSSDDDFREHFLRSPGDALQELGYAPAAAGMAGFAPESTAHLGAAACLSVSQLASKEAIRAAREDLQGFLTAALANNPQILNA